ncbi:MAG: CDP-alcohol phosphatidyltransferase family protein [Candidatus Hydrogenedentes bacterium]|nr:CDP-alcohol phosphatidyltransferase family protein [Candidatus Hydrogenedentota bacterium]
MSNNARPPSPAQTLFAWSVHALTASGALVGFLAVAAVYRHEWVASFVWLVVATAIDSCDGFLARRARVHDVLPHFDGALLDNIVDYFTYVLVPAFLIHEAGLLPAQFSLAAVALIVLASAYQFCQADAKTDDHYFKGFPSYWNVVAFYLFFMQLPSWTNLAVIVALAVSVFVPVKYLYPSRAQRFRGLTIVLTLIWSALLIAVLARYPGEARPLLWGSLVFVAYYYAMSLYMTFARPSPRD